MPVLPGSPLAGRGERPESHHRYRICLAVRRRTNSCGPRILPPKCFHSGLCILLPYDHHFIGHKAKLFTPLRSLYPTRDFIHGNIGFFLSRTGLARSLDMVPEQAYHALTSAKKYEKHGFFSTKRGINLLRESKRHSTGHAVYSCPTAFF